jgi:hypothetical protein
VDEHAEFGVAIPFARGFNENHQDQDHEEGSDPRIQTIIENHHLGLGDLLRWDFSLSNLGRQIRGMRQKANTGMRVEQLLIPGCHGHNQQPRQRQ